MIIMIGVLDFYVQDSLIFLGGNTMKKILWYAVLGNANIAADGMSAAVATSWLHGPIHYHKKFTVEIPDTILNDPEKYVKNHPSGTEFVRKVISPHNPSVYLPGGSWKDTKLEYSSKFNMMRILGSFNNGLFIEL